MAKPRSYDHAHEKLHQARSALMAPHGELGEQGAFAEAFRLVRMLRPEEIAGLPEPASDYWAEILRLTDTKGLKDPDGRGLFAVRIASMNELELSDFSRNVDELASWFSEYHAERRRD